MKRYALLFGALFPLLPNAQTIAAVEPGGQFFIGANATVAFDKLVLRPTVDVNITGGNAVTKTPAIVRPSANRAIHQAFQFLNTVTAYTGSVTVYYNDADLNGLAEGTLTPNVHDGSVWRAYPATAANTTDNFVTASGLTNASLNEVTLAAAAAPLPVRLVSLAAACNAGSVKLTWRTAGEMNNRRFDVERSSDGSLWQRAGSVPGAGTTATERTYGFTDTATPAKFYRLAQVDDNNQKAYSAVLKTECGTQAVFRLYPNPFTNRVTIVVSSDAEGDALFLLRDVTGRLVRTVKRHLQKGTNYLSVSLPGVAAGRYFLSREGEPRQTVLLVKPGE